MQRLEDQAGPVEEPGGRPGPGPSEGGDHRPRVADPAVLIGVGFEASMDILVQGDKNGRGRGDEDQGQAGGLGFPSCSPSRGGWVRNSQLSTEAPL